VEPSAVATASKRLTSARLIEKGDLTPFADSSLDGLILADVIEHIPAAWDALISYVRAVKPGGWVVISVPNMRYIGALRTFVIGGDWPEVPLGIFDRTHIQVMTHKRLHRWCHAADLWLEREFDAYDYRFIRRNIHRIINLGSFRLLKSFLNFEIQACYRKGSPVVVKDR
jgi:predicted SAM-dependent methyltransferase